MKGVKGSCIRFHAHRVLDFEFAYCIQLETVWRAHRDYELFVAMDKVPLLLLFAVASLWVRGHVGPSQDTLYAQEISDPRGL